LTQREIEDFCKVASSTVKDWISNSHPARGERLLRLWHLLALRGSESPELQKLPALNRYLGELLAFGLVSIEEAGEMAGVKNSQTLHKVLRGQVPVHPKTTVRQLRARYDEQLRKARAAMADPYPGMPISAAPPKQSELEPSPSEFTNGSNLLLVSAAASFNQTLTYARYFASDTCTPEERSMLRALMDRPDAVYQESMAELARLTTSLCSERARNHGR
jgi:hypothetical protein